MFCCISDGKCSEKVLQLRQSLVALASDAQVESSPVIDLDSLFTSGSELDECVKKLQELKAPYCVTFLPAAALDSLDSIRRDWESQKYAKVQYNILQVLILLILYIIL